MMGQERNINYGEVAPPTQPSAADFQSQEAIAELQQRYQEEGQPTQLPAEQSQDPFAMTQYSDVGVPDQPITYGGGMADSLLNDNEVPEDVRKRYWFVFHKDNVLTFLDEQRKSSKLMNFDIAKIDYLNSIPYYDYDFEKELEFTVLRNVFETKLDRALGFKTAALKNERTVLQSQFTENRQISEMGEGNNIKEGFFKRLLGRR
jgi:hypothetical protein